jgi:hypothetical protein
MRSTVDIAVVVGIVIRNGVDDLTRLLGSGSIVEPHQVVAVHLLAQHGEVLAEFGGVQGVGLLVIQVAQLVGLGDAAADSRQSRPSDCPP